LKSAKAGEIKNFTGVDAPYEAPTAREIQLESGSPSNSPRKW
jgi:adenylylsulfate kinase-like enzyme